MCHSDGVSAILYILERKVRPGHTTLMEFIVEESGFQAFFFGILDSV